MPKRNDINSILIIGAGPIVIGQACEFDYSGTQACQVLKSEGYKVILINSNPATIMTDPDTADITYIEPITLENVVKIITKERPDAILPTMGGQTALNIAMQLEKNGSLEKFDVEMIGAKSNSIEMAEDRMKFKQAMKEIGLNSAKSKLATNMSEAFEAFDYVGLPAIIRPSFTLGGEGSGIAYNKDMFEEICKQGFSLSPLSEVLIEESLIGWKEFEMEVVRDNKDNCIMVCSIENIDPMGVHTGDSITVAPALTLTDKEFQHMRDSSFSVLRKIGVDTGGSNVQFAVNPLTGKQIVIEMNPRVSRSSALASKATGFPIARIATQLAIGYSLNELNNEITGETPASFEPTIDYVVTKIPRFTFEKFPGSNKTLTTSMKSVGEAMSIGRNFKESLQKALRSIENNLDGLNEIEIPNFDNPKSVEIFFNGWLSQNCPEKILRIAEAFRFGISKERVSELTQWDNWFINQIYEIVSIELSLKNGDFKNTEFELLRLKMNGFSDKRISDLISKDKNYITDLRHKLNIHPVYKRIDTCANEFNSQTAYMYSCYENKFNNKYNCESFPTDNKKIIILGGGPNRIGQGIEFDYCCVHASYSLREDGYETIMVNCNPETVSTDYNTSDRLYFEPLTDEDVLEIVRCEKQSGDLLGVIVQLGGQTPLNIAKKLDLMNIPILGTSQISIDLAEDREKFKKIIDKLQLKQPQNDTCKSFDEAQKIIKKIGFPIIIRPSYVLGGRGMEIINNIEDLKVYIGKALDFTEDNTILIEKYLKNATEVDVDAICDNEDIYIAGIMEHIEEAGIHSGDSACVIPTQNLSNKVLNSIKLQTQKLALELKIIGLINIQFAVQNEEVYLLEVNPRGSRTVPFVAKSTGVPVAKIASKVIVGRKLKTFHLPKNCNSLDYVSVKESVFPFARFPGCEIKLGPEMKSTGEVMGIDNDFPKAFAKSQTASNLHLPLKGSLFISVKDSDKPSIIYICKLLTKSGFNIFATIGTSNCLRKNGLIVKEVKKITEGNPNILDLILSKKIQLIINTMEDSQTIKDNMILRRHAIAKDIPYFTTLSAAIAATKSIETLISSSLEVKSIQEYLKKKNKTS